MCSECVSKVAALRGCLLAGHLAHKLFDVLEVMDKGLLGLSEVGVIVFV